ncbi:MAG: hypothetical protein CM1200mP41_04080 [Gammaproteobacteria bacterium]|nr:MAG: hypothetical protein CM1200mP41_04080 [Gammaproteobacteria bacterium]
MTMTPGDRGYRFVRGRVQRTVLGKKWFEFHLQHNFVIFVQRARWQQYFRYSPCGLDQANVVVRGWVSGKVSACERQLATRLCWSAVRYWATAMPLVCRGWPFSSIAVACFECLKRKTNGHC